MSTLSVKYESPRKFESPSRASSPGKLIAARKKRKLAAMINDKKQKVPDPFFVGTEKKETGLHIDPNDASQLRKKFKQDSDLLLSKTTFLE